MRVQEVGQESLVTLELLVWWVRGVPVVLLVMRGPRVLLDLQASHSRKDYPGSSGWREVPACRESSECGDCRAGKVPGVNLARSCWGLESRRWVASHRGVSIPARNSKVSGLKPGTSAASGEKAR